MISALLLADGRLPAGGHAHSGGMEAAVASGRVCDLITVEQYLIGVLQTCGQAAAAMAAAACSGAHRWEDLDAETDARTPSPGLRASSRRQGRLLARAALAMWPDPVLSELMASSGQSPHHAPAMGAAARAAGLTPLDAARCTIYWAVTGPAGAAVKLIGLDPLAVHALVAGLASRMETAAQTASRDCRAPLARIPCPGAPLLDLYAQSHAEAALRLFAS